MTEHERAEAWQPPAEWRTSGTDHDAVDWVGQRGVPGLADAAGAAAVRAVQPVDATRPGTIERDSQVAFVEAHGA